MRRLFALVSAVVLVDTMFYAAIAPLLPTYAEDLGLSKTAAGVLSASYAAGTLIASIPMGFYVARVGVRVGMLTGLTLLACSSFVFAFANDLVLLDAARFAQGVGGASAWTSGLAWIMAAAPRERRGKMIGAVLAVAIAGIMLGPVIGGIATVAGPEPVFSAVGVLAIGVAARALSEPSATPRPAPEARMIFAGILSPPVLVAVWLVALPSIFAGLMDVLVPLRLDALGASGVAIGAVFLIAAAIEAAVSPTIGSFSDRRGRALPIRLGLITSAVACLALPLPQTVALLGLATVAAVLAMSLLWTPAMALLSESAERAGLDLAFAAALVNLSWAGGQVIGGGSGSALAEGSSDAIALGFVAVLFAGTAIAVARTRRRLGRATPAPGGEPAG